MAITKDGLKIEFLARYNHPGRLLYDVRLTNASNKTIEYDMRNLQTSAGRNVIFSNSDYKVDGIPLLNKGELKKYESVEGLVLFIPSNFLCTSVPIFYFNGEKIKVKLKKEHKDKMKEKYKKGL